MLCRNPQLYKNGFLRLDRWNISRARSSKKMKSAQNVWEAFLIKSLWCFLHFALCAWVDTSLISTAPKAEEKHITNEGWPGLFWSGLNLGVWEQFCCSFFHNQKKPGTRVVLLPGTMNMGWEWLHSSSWGEAEPVVDKLNGAMECTSQKGLSFPSLLEPPALSFVSVLAMT